MLGLDWTELALIAVVAVIIIGPKDLPEAVRGVAKGVQKLRRMAGELQGQLDEVVREAKLEDVRSQINEIRNFDFRGAVEREIDKDGTLRKTFNEDPIGNPLKDAWESKPAEHGATITPPPEPPPETPDGPRPSEAAPAPPAFVPPSVSAVPAPADLLQTQPPAPAPAELPTRSGPGAAA